MDRYEKMRKPELLALARKAGVRGRSRMSKAELAEVLAALSRPAEAVIPASGAPHKAPVAAEPAQAPVPAAAELPRFLGEHRACLLPQGPRKAYVYWEISEESISGALETLGVTAARLFMRVYEWVGTGRLAQTHDIFDRLGSWYIDLNSPGMDLWVELVMEAGGHTVVLVSSNRVRLPREEPSEEVESLWMTRRRHFEEIFRLSGGAPAGAASRGAFPGRFGKEAQDVTSWRGVKKEEKR